MHEFFDHTGDIGVRLSGATLAELFESASAAFVESLTDPAAVEPRRAEEVAVEAPELDLLLVDFLSELLYRFDTRGWITADAEVDVREKDGGWLLDGTLRGERLDPDRHGIKVLVKAITYHALHVRREAGLWKADVVFDI
ncbi:MAG: archease [Acidobacteriota bacterium]